MRALGREHGFTLVDSLVVIALIGIVAAMAIPMSGSTSRAFRIKGDAQAIANMVSLAKMRASALYSRTRIRADLASDSLRMEIWTPTNPANKFVGSWVTDGPTVMLSNGVTFGFAGRTEPPTDMQTAIDQSPECTGQNSLDADLQADTACIIFNSRGIPIGNDGQPRGGNALYITNGATVYATIITATPLVRQWLAHGTTGDWIRQ